MTRRQLPSRELSGNLGALPAVATDFSVVDTYINYIMLTNTTAGALTVTITDKQTPARNIVPPAVSIPALTSVLFLFGDSCLKAKGGINWTASGAGVEGTVFGYITG